MIGLVMVVRAAAMVVLVALALGRESARAVTIKNLVSLSLIPQDVLLRLEVSHVTYIFEVFNPALLFIKFLNLSACILIHSAVAGSVRADCTVPLQTGS